MYEFQIPTKNIFKLQQNNFFFFIIYFKKYTYNLYNRQGIMSKCGDIKT